MRPNKYLWIALSAFFSSLGIYLLTDSLRHSGPYTEAYFLLGSTLTALGLAAMLFAFKQRAQIRALAQHMRLGSSSSRGQRRRGSQQL